jgi:hypothetical protein
MTRATADLLLGIFLLVIGNTFWVYVGIVFLVMGLYSTIKHTKGK